MVSKELKLKDVYDLFTQQTKNFIDEHYPENKECRVSTITSDMAFMRFDGWFNEYSNEEFKGIFDEIRKYEFVLKEDL